MIKKWAYSTRVIVYRLSEKGKFETYGFFNDVRSVDGQLDLPFARFFLGQAQ